MRLPVVPPPLPEHAQQGSLAATLRALAPGARPSEIWRGAAFALLRLNPGECDALALLFEHEESSDELRMTVLDLLAGAGTFEAQVVIRRLLALAVARRSARTFAMFVQRLGIVECPDGPTLRFLMSVYAESRTEPHDVRAACAYALGAAAGQAFASGDPEAAVRASDVLRRDLLSAGTPIDKCALLTALGNAGVPSDVMVITRFTQDAEPPVRAAAALALRKMPVPEARTQLVALLADGERVAQSALAALGEQKLDDADLDRLAELVLGGRTPREIDGRVLRLLVAQRAQLGSAPGRASLLEQALRLLLGRLEASGVHEPAGSGERRVVSPRAHESFPPPPSPPPARTVSAPPVAVAATVLDQPLQRRLAYAREAPRAQPSPAAVVSGSYRVVSPPSPDAARDLMVQLGLDPNAKPAELPKPPPRRATSEAPVSLPDTPRQSLEIHPLNRTRIGPYGPGAR